MKFECFIPMIPPTVTAQEHKVTVVNGKPRFYDPPEVKAAKQKLLDHLVQYAPGYCAKYGVRLIVKWCFPIAATDKYRMDGDYRTTKPDTDNLQKFLKDCMTELGFWQDDAQVCSEIVEKFWAEKPGLYISVQDGLKNGYDMEVLS